MDNILITVLAFAFGSLLGAWAGYYFNRLKTRDEQRRLLKDELNERFYDINDIHIKISKHHSKFSDDFKKACSHDAPVEIIKELALKEDILKYYSLREEFRQFLNKKAHRYLKDSLLNAIRVFLYAEEGYYDFIAPYELNKEVDLKKFYRSIADPKTDRIREQARKDVKKYLKAKGIS